MALSLPRSPLTVTGSPRFQPGSLTLKDEEYTIDTLMNIIAKGTADCKYF